MENAGSLSFTPDQYKTLLAMLNQRNQRDKVHCDRFFYTDTIFKIPKIQLQDSTCFVVPTGDLILMSFNDIWTQVICCLVGCLFIKEHENK